MGRIWKGWVGQPRPRAMAIAISAALAAWTTTSQANEGPLVAVEVLRRTPISFERNDGQFPSEVLYVARGLAGHISLRRGELCLAPPAGARFDANCDPQAGALRLKFARANAAPETEGRDVLATRSHYYFGPRRYENVPHFRALRLSDVYPQIDLELHGTQGALEYDFIVAPGGDPSSIALDVSAARSVRVDDVGQLVMDVAGRTLVQRAPVAWQEWDGERTLVDARFALRETASGPEAYFVLDEYDPNRALVIDPVLSYSTYLGGTASDLDGYVQVDSAGKLYVAHSLAFVTGTSVVLTKLDPVSNTVVFETTIDGGNHDVVQALAIGASGAGAASYLVGYTSSQDGFPTCSVGCPALVHGGGYDAFVTVLDHTGAIARSWLLGGSADDQAGGVAVDAARNIHVVGTTNSLDFPTTALALYPNHLGSSADSSDAFVAKLSLAAGLQYATYLGGSANDYGTAIALDSSGSMYIGGNTDSGNFPKVNAALSAPHAMFVTKIGASGGPILYSTNLGGSGDDLVALAVEPGSNKLWITGDTSRSNFLGSSASGFCGSVGASGTFCGGRDVFLSRLGTSGGPLEFSTLIGGSAADYAGGIVLGASGSGDVYITGSTNGDFPNIGGTGNPGDYSAFVARLRGSAFDYSSSLGGSSSDYGNSIAISSIGEVYVAGSTTSIDFPTVSPYSASKQGASDVFVSRLLFEPGPPRNVSVLSGDGQLTFNFASPFSTGGSTITGYTVTCNPGGLTASGSGSPIVLTGLTNGVQYNCTLTATNGVGTGTSTSSVFARPAAPVTLSTVVSRRVHGGVEIFDWSVDPAQPLGGSPTIEGRSGTQVVVFNFTGPIYSNTFIQVKDAQNNFYSASQTLGGSSVVASFSGVPNGKRVTVSLFNVNNANYSPSVSLSLMAGDLNGSRSVTASDILIAKGKSGELVAGGNFQYDVDVDHNLTSSDVDAVKARSGTEQQ